MPAINKDTTNHRVRLAMHALEHLPPAPEAMVALWKVIDHPDTTLDTLCRIIMSDAALSMSLLRLVNSASFGLSRRIVSVREAVHFVGFGEVKTLSIAIVVKTGLLLRQPRLQCVDRVKLWRHMVGAGLAAQALARKVAVPLADEAFTAGLVHDVGMIVVDQAIPQEMQQVIAGVEASPLEIEDIELRLLGFTHGQVGRWLGEQWDFPEPLLVSMEHHWKPVEAPSHRELCALVHVGDALANEEGSYIRTRRKPSIDPQALQILRLDAAQLEPVRRQFRQDLAKVATLLELA